MRNYLVLVFYNAFQAVQIQFVKCSIAPVLIGRSRPFRAIVAKMNEDNVLWARIGQDTTTQHPDRFLEAPRFSSGLRRRPYSSTPAVQAVGHRPARRRASVTSTGAGFLDCLLRQRLVPMCLGVILD